MRSLFPLSLLSLARTHTAAPGVKPSIKRRQVQADLRLRMDLESCEALEEKHDANPCKDLDTNKDEGDCVDDHVKHQHIRLQADVIDMKRHDCDGDEA